jgi:hypothetical protein
MALNMNDFSGPAAGLRKAINGPVLASVGVAFAAGLASAMLLSGPDASSTPAPVATTASADTNCSDQTWPYRDQKCRDAEAAERKLRDVRIVSTDKTQPARIVKSAVSEGASQSQTASNRCHRRTRLRRRPLLRCRWRPLPFRPLPGQSRRPFRSRRKRR